MSEAHFHEWMCWGQIALAAVTFVALLWLDAPYGRHVRRGWGPTMSTRWMWVVMESPACIGFAVLFFVGGHRFELVPLSLLLLWQIHYAHRTLIYPLRIRTDKRTPVVVALMGMLFQTVNSYINARQISEFGHYASAWLIDPRMWIGTALFFLGMHINRKSDRALISLRRDAGDGYQIPKGGLFDWVSCPNYLGEMIEWTGWAIATWSIAGLAFALYTVANLLPRAIAHHRWYRQKFASYPAQRRAVIPFIL